MDDFEIFSGLSVAQIRRFCRSAQRFASEEPWEWLLDEDLFGVKDYRTGVTGWCTVTGARGTDYGLQIFLGDRGFWKRLDVVIGRDVDYPEVFVGIDALMFSFVSEEEITEREKAALEEFLGSDGITIHGEKYWLWARRLQPWFYPRPITADECGFLCDVMQQACVVAKRVSKNCSLTLNREDGSFLVRTKGSESSRGSWKDSWEWPQAYVKPRVEAKYNQKKISKALKKAHATEESWDIDTFPVLIPIWSRRGLYFPRTVLVLNSDSSSIVYTDVVEPDERDWTGVLNIILEAMAETLSIPKTIRVRDDSLHNILSPLEDVLGFGLKRVEMMPFMDAAIKVITDVLGPET